MREIFKAQDKDPGAVFYTITEGDVGRTEIITEIGPIHVRDFMGRILGYDVGKRLVRVRCDDPRAGWIWQVENAAQLAAKTGREAQ